MYLNPGRITDTTFDIQWELWGSALNETDVVTYNIYVDGEFVETVPHTQDMMSYTVTNLLPTTDYEVVVIAFKNGQLLNSANNHVTTYATPVFFEDAGLEHAVRNYLYIEADRDIEQSDVEQLEWLYASDYGIRSLKGLEHAKNLKYLYLGSNQITDLSPISNFTNLEELNVEDNAIADLRPIANLSNLTNLDVDNNAITDLSPLTNLTSISLLHISGNRISDFSPLANLTNVTNLSIRNTGITDLTPISNLINLEYLYADNNEISDLNAISNLTNLIGLDVEGNNISDISVLLSLDKLSYVYGSNNPITEEAQQVIDALIEKGVYVYFDEITPVDETAPAEVTNAQATNVTTNSATITWTNPSDEDFAQANVYVNGSLAGSLLDSEGTSYDLTGLTPETAYTVKITTVDETGNESAGVEVTFTTEREADVIAPAEVTNAQATNVTTTSATITWTNPSDEDFAQANVYVNGSLSRVLVDGEGTSYDLTGLTPETAYTVKITTVDETGNESAGVEVTFTTEKEADVTSPAEVTNAQATNVTTTSATITWTNPSDEDFAKTNVYVNGSLVGALLDSEGTSYDLTGLTPETAYTVKITTVDETGNESAGVEVTFTTEKEADVIAPAEVTNAQATNVTTNSATITWTNPSDEDFAQANVYVNGSLSRVFVDGEGTSYDLTGLTPETAYTVKITTVDETGNESAGVEVTFTTEKEITEEPVFKWELIDGSWYYMDQFGNKKTGWLDLANTWYYMNAEGIMQTGWEQVGSTWYYFAGSGAMATGWAQLGGTWYYFAGSGAMATGWAQLGGTWYYFASSGAMATGWAQLGGTWYYFASSGAMATGWAQLGGTWYYFASSGAMATGWAQLGGTWYYFASSGAMQTGWQLIGGKWYYFYSSGQMASNTTIEGYKLDNSGAMI